MARVLTPGDGPRWMTQGGWQSEREPPLGEKRDDVHPTLALFVPFAFYLVACAAIVVFIAVKARSIPLW